MPRECAAGSASGVICQKSIEDPFIGCYAQPKVEKGNDPGSNLSMILSKHAMRMECNKICVGSPFFLISMDMKCFCMSEWPQGGELKWVENKWKVVKANSERVYLDVILCIVLPQDWLTKKNVETLDQQIWQMASRGNGCTRVGPRVVQSSR